MSTSQGTHFTHLAGSAEEEAQVQPLRRGRHCGHRQQRRDEGSAVLLQFAAAATTISMMVIIIIIIIISIIIIIIVTTALVITDHDRSWLKLLLYDCIDQYGSQETLKSVLASIAPLPSKAWAKTLKR